MKEEEEEKKERESCDREQQQGKRGRDEKWENERIIKIIENILYNFTGWY